MHGGHRPSHGPFQIRPIGRATAGLRQLMSYIFRYMTKYCV